MFEIRTCLIKKRKNKSGSYSITSPYASACWFGYNQNNKAHSQHLPPMSAGSTCADDVPTCIHNPYNNELSQTDPDGLSWVCKPYIDLVANTGADKQFAVRLAKACLVGYDTYRRSNNDILCRWCSDYENIGVYNN